MTPHRVHSLDDISRFRHVWVGGKGWTWPVQASYLAWGLCAGLFAAVLATTNLIGVDRDIPAFLLGSVLATSLLVKCLDHDRPVRTLLPTLRQHVDAPAGRARPRVERPCVSRVHVTGEDPR